MSIENDYVPAIIIHPSGVETVTGTFSPTFKFPYKEYVAILDVSASAGATELLDVTIEEFDPATGDWFEIDAFTQATGVTNERVLHNADGLGRIGA